MFRINGLIFQREKKEEKLFFQSNFSLIFTFSKGLTLSVHLVSTILTIKGKKKLQRTHCFNLRHIIFSFKKSEIYKEGEKILTHTQRQRFTMKIHILYTGNYFNKQPLPASLRLN